MSLHDAPARATMAATVLAPRTRGHLPPPCPCGYCRTEHGFCAAHQARLAAIRDGWQTARSSRSRAGARKRSPGVPMCCLPGCMEPREPGEHYCWEHAGEAVPE